MSVIRQSWWLGLALIVTSASAQPFSSAFQTLTIDPEQSVLSLDLTLAQTSVRIAGEIDVQYDLGVDSDNLAGITELRGVLVEPIDLDLGLFTITAPADSIDALATADPGAVPNPAFQLPSIPSVSVFEFTQPGITLSLDGTLLLSDGEVSGPIDLGDGEPSLNQAIMDATLSFDQFSPGLTTLIAPIDSVFSLPLGDVTIPVLITGTIVASADAGIPCDYDGSGQVDQGDLDLVLNNWGQPRGNWENAEGFVTENVDQEELDCILNHWGRTSAPSLDGVRVPEPALALMGVGAIGFLRRR